MTTQEILTNARQLGAKLATVYNDEIRFENKAGQLIDVLPQTIENAPAIGTKFDGSGEVISNELHRQLLLGGWPCASFQKRFVCDDLEIGTFNIKL